MSETELETAVTALIRLADDNDIDNSLMLRRDGMVWWAYFCNPTPWEPFEEVEPVFRSMPGTALEAVLSVTNLVREHVAISAMIKRP